MRPTRVHKITSLGTAIFLAAVILPMTPHLQAGPPEDKDHPIGFVVDLAGDWVLEPGGGVIQLGQGILPNVRIRALDPDSGSSKIVIALADATLWRYSCEAEGSCGLPISLPSLPETPRLSERFQKVVQYMLKNRNRIAILCTRSGTGESGGPHLLLTEGLVPLLPDGTFPIEPCILKIQDGEYALRLYAVRSDATIHPEEEPIELTILHRDGKTSIRMSRPCRTGLYEMVPEDQDLPGHKFSNLGTLVYVAGEEQMKHLSEDFRLAVHTADRWKKSQEEGLACQYVRASLLLIGDQRP